MPLEVKQQTRPGRRPPSPRRPCAWFVPVAAAPLPRETPSLFFLQGTRSLPSENRVPVLGPAAGLLPTSSLGGGAGAGPRCARSGQRRRQAPAGLRSYRLRLDGGVGRGQRRGAELCASQPLTAQAENKRPCCLLPAAPVIHDMLGLGHAPASPSTDPPSGNLRSRSVGFADRRGGSSQSPQRPSPAISPHRAVLTGSLSPKSPSRRRSKRSVDDADNDVDDRSEIAWSEASTRAAYAPPLQQGPGSKRARQLMEAVQRSRPDRLTAEMLEAKMSEDASSPARNLRSHAHRSLQQFAPAGEEGRIEDKDERQRRANQPPATRSPHRDGQMKIVSFSVQTRTVGMRRPSTTPESYVRLAVDNGDVADLLRISCALGFLLSSDGGQVMDPGEAMSYIDDAVHGASNAFRAIAREIVGEIQVRLPRGCS